MRIRPLRYLAAGLVAVACATGASVAQEAAVEQIVVAFQETVEDTAGAAEGLAAATVVEEAAEAPSTAAAPDTTFIFNTLLFLIMGMVVMFMAAGFCMLEAGLVRSKNAATICLKNVTLYAIATVMVWLVG